MKRIYLYILLLGILTSLLFSFEVPIAEFQSVSENDQIQPIDSVGFSQALFTSLTVQDRAGLIGFKYKNREATGGTIKSQMDAVKNCEINGWELVVYGQILVRESGYDIEIKVYSHPERQILRTFLLRSSIADYDTLITDCAVKIFSYFSDMLHVSEDKKPFIAEADSLVTSHTIEWWGLIPPWLDSSVSIIGYHGTFGFRSGSPIWTNGEWAWLQEFGLGVGFHFGMGKSDVIDSKQYDIDLGPIATWAFVWQRQQEIRVSLEPGVKIHVLNYQPMYDDAKVSAWTWYGGQLDIEYRFWIDSNRTFGIGLEAGVAAYFTDPFYLDYRVGVDFAWKGMSE